MFFFLISSCVSVVILLVVALINVNQVLGTTTDRPTVSVYLDPNATSEQEDKLRSLLSSDVRVEKLEFQSKEEIYESFNKSFPEYSQGLNLSEEGGEVIPSVFEITLKSKDYLDAVTADIKIFPFIKSVQGALDWMGKVATGRKLIAFVIWGFFVFVFTVMIFITIAVILRTISNEKEKIQIYSFCGASHRQIIKKIFMQFAGISLSSLATGLLIAYLCYLFLYDRLSKIDVDNIYLSRFVFLDFESLVLFVLFFVSVIYLSIFFSAQKIIREVSSAD